MFPAGVSAIRTRYVELSSGLRLRVAESGDSRARPVLLLHGWGASLYMWRDWFAPLSAAGYRPIAVDLPGHGLSDRPDDPQAYRLSSQVAAIAALLDAEEMGPTLVVAQSMAGTIALELTRADDSRVAGLVLVNPACFGRVRLQRVGRLLSPRLVGRLLPRLVSRWSVARAHRLVYGDPSRITPRDVDEYWAPSQFPSYALAMWRLVHEFEWTRAPADAMGSRLRELAPPTLVILGGRDRLVREARPYVDALVAAGARVAVRVVAEGGHAVNEELPETVIPIALAFLREGGPPGRAGDAGQHDAT